MAKKRKKKRPEKIQQSWGPMNIQKEAAYIIGRAQQHEGRIVTLGSLVFFSTETGDAWMLDTEDDYALCLARNGSRQSFRIVETETSLAVEWDKQFQIEGDTFTVTDRSGQVTSIVGYPTASILEAIQRAESHPGLE